MDDSAKFQVIAEKIGEIKKRISSLAVENQQEHNKRVEEILAVTKMPGPEGRKGDKGDKGDQGKDGVDGVDGKDGKDAPKIVEIWIDNADKHLMFKMDDDTVWDAGEIPLDDLKAYIGGGGYTVQRNVQEIRAQNQFIEVYEEGAVVETEVSILDFVGASVTASSPNSNKVTITIDAPTRDEFNSLETRVTNNETNISNNTTQINNNTTAISNNSTRITNIESSTTGSNTGDQNLFSTVSADVGSTTADTLTDTLSVSGGNGISTSIVGDTLSITNDAPDQVVTLTGGTGISTSGTYPNFTVTNTAPDQVVTITEGANITVTGTYPNFTIASSVPATRAVRTTSSASQTLTSGAFTILDFDSVQYNTDTNLYSVSAAGRITVAESGIYSIDCGTVIQASVLSAIAETAVAIFVNNNIVAIETNETTLSASSQRGHGCSTTLQLSANDIVDVRAYVESVLGLGTILNPIVAALFGQTATQVNHLAITKQ